MRRAKHTQSLESVVLAVATRDDTVGTPTRVCRTAAVTALSGPPKIALSPFSDPLSMGRTDPRCTLPNRRRPRTAPLSNHRHLKSQGRQASCSVMLRETRHRRAARHAMRCAAAGLDPSVRWAPARAGHATHPSLKAMRTVSQETAASKMPHRCEPQVGSTARHALCCRLAGSIGALGACPRRTEDTQRTGRSIVAQSHEKPSCCSSPRRQAAWKMQHRCKGHLH